MTLTPAVIGIVVMLVGSVLLAVLVSWALEWLGARGHDVAWAERSPHPRGLQHGHRHGDAAGGAGVFGCDNGAGGGSDCG